MARLPSKKDLVLYTGGLTVAEIERLHDDLKKDKRHFLTLLFAQDIRAFVPTNSVSMMGAYTIQALEAAGKMVAQLSDKEIEEFLAD